MHKTIRSLVGFNIQKIKINVLTFRHVSGERRLHFTFCAREKDAFLAKLHTVSVGIIIMK